MTLEEERFFVAIRKEYWAAPDSEHFMPAFTACARRDMQLNTIR